MKNSFLHYYLLSFFKPGKVFEELLADNRKLRYGFYAVLICAVLYTFVYVFLIFGGGQPYKPWLKISDEVYYRYNVFFLAPSMFFGWILSTGVAQLLSRLFNGKGNFEDTLSVFGFGIGIASWATGVHDLITSFLGAIHVINQREFESALNSPTIWRTVLWILMIFYLVWFVILFSLGIRESQKIKLWQSVVVGTASFVVYQFFFFLFNR